MMPAPGEGLPKSRQRRLLGKGLIVIVEGVKYSETSFVHSPYIPSILVRLPLPLYRIRRRENRHLSHVFVRAARRLSIVAAVDPLMG